MREPACWQSATNKQNAASLSCKAPILPPIHTNTLLLLLLQLLTATAAGLWPTATAAPPATPAGGSARRRGEWSVSCLLAGWCVCSVLLLLLLLLLLMLLLLRPACHAGRLLPS
jgi:hypothetical protein